MVFLWLHQGRVLAMKGGLKMVVSLLHGPLLVEGDSRNASTGNVARQVNHGNFLGSQN